MIKTIEVEIKIDDLDPTLCSIGCRFFQPLSRQSYCGLFNAYLEYTGVDILYKRDKKCVKFKGAFNV